MSLCINGDGFSLFSTISVYGFLGPVILLNFLINHEFRYYVNIYYVCLVVPTDLCFYIVQSPLHYT